MSSWDSPVRPRRRHERHFETLTERFGNPLQHGQRVTLVIRILEARDDGLFGVDQLGELPIGYVPPVEYETMYYQRQMAPVMLGGVK